MVRRKPAIEAGVGHPSARIPKPPTGGLPKAAQEILERGLKKAAEAAPMIVGATGKVAPKVAKKTKAAAAPAAKKAGAGAAAKAAAARAAKQAKNREKWYKKNVAKYAQSRAKAGKPLTDQQKSDYYNRIKSMAEARRAERAK